MALKVGDIVPNFTAKDSNGDDFDSKEYIAIKQIHDKYTTADTKLVEINHHFSSQQNESMNMLITKFAPKNITYCKILS